jgi:hypothetical protein
MVGVELMHLGSAHPHGPGRNHENVRVFGHRRESRIRIFEHEFGVSVLLPGGQHGLLVERELIHRTFLCVAGTQSLSVRVPPEDFAADTLGLSVLSSSSASCGIVKRSCMLTLR